MIEKNQGKSEKRRSADGKDAEPSEWIAGDRDE
jgi:hypothetical protein